MALARGWGGGTGAFVCANALAALLGRGLDLNRLWIDLAPLGSAPAAWIEVVAGIVLTTWAVRPDARRMRRGATALATVALLWGTARRGALFYVGLHRGEWASPVPIPPALTLTVPLLLVLIALRIGGRRPLRWLPWYVLREVPAFWVYWARSFVRSPSREV